MGEFIGSAFICFWGVGLTVPNVVTKSITTQFEFSVWFGILFAFTIAIFIPISYAHFNPAISLAWAVFHKLDWKLVPAYVAAQVAGWGIGTVLLYFLYGSFLSEWADSTGTNPAQLFYCTAQEGDLFGQILMEMLLAAMLIFAIFVLADSRNPNIPSKGMYSFVVGAIIAINISWGADYSGACFNPARDFGPRVVSYIYGLVKGYDISAVFSGHLWLVYLLAPCIGGILGGAFYFGVVGRMLSNEKSE